MMNSNRIISQIGPVFALRFVKALCQSLVIGPFLLGFPQISLGQEAPGAAASHYFGRRHGDAISERPHLRR